MQNRIGEITPPYLTPLLTPKGSENLPFPLVLNLLLMYILSNNLQTRGNWAEIFFTEDVCCSLMCCGRP